LALLKETTDLILACLSMQEANLVVSEYLPKLFDGNSGAICVLDSAGSFVETVASWGDTKGWERAFLPEHCWSLRRARLHYVRESQQALRCSHLGGHVPAWYLCIPLIAHGQAIGLLHINSKGAGGPVTQDGSLDLPGVDSGELGLSPYKQQLAETTGEQLGMALANLQLREALRTQAVRDPLTGLFNRRYMEEALTREVHRAKRSSTSFGCIMLDLDYFKKFNDTHGHAAGDMLLRHVGAFLQN
jgi:GAF domain-containing protein